MLYIGTAIYDIARAVCRRDRRPVRAQIDRRRRRRRHVPYVCAGTGARGLGCAVGKGFKSAQTPLPGGTAAAVIRPSHRQHRQSADRRVPCVSAGPSRVLFAHVHTHVHNTHTHTVAQPYRRRYARTACTRHCSHAVPAPLSSRTAAPRVPGTWAFARHRQLTVA